MFTYPLMLKISGRRCLVVGAGAVGLRRAEALARAGSAVRLVSPQEPAGPLPPGAELLAEPYQSGHLEGCLLAFACTDDPALNARIAQEARSAGILVNVADEPEDCDFFVPATCAQGEVVLAVGTGGACPDLARQLRDRLAARLPQRVGEFAAALASIRRQVQVREADPARRKAILETLAGPRGYNAFVQGRLIALLEAEISRLRE
jgi:precorrin-2 dehydrogenase/sirohydrochlorin ferrochelatase